MLIAQRGSIDVPIDANIAESAFATATIGSIVSSIVGVAITLSGVAVMIFLVWGGYEWLTSGGDKGKIDAARSKITNAIIGIAIVASAYVIFSLVNKFFGIGIIT